MKVALYRTAVWMLAATGLAWGQHPSDRPVPLAELVSEAQASNAQIAAAQHAWKAASQAVPAASSLPDRRLTVQQLSVGSPRPFAGYTNSDFAYIGFGASQDLPFPGKLRLRGQVAARQADAARAEAGVTQANVLDAVKADYIHLAYLQQSLALLNEDKAALDELIKDATIHYQVGQGMQQDLLHAQIEHTKLVRDVAKHHQDVAETEAHLKALLHRDQESADIVTEALRETPLSPTSAELLNEVRARNPQVEALQADVEHGAAKLGAERRESKPDFTVSYMYQNTDPKYRDYYMWTVDMRLPRKRRVNAEVAQATEELAQSKDALDAQVQQQLGAVKEQYVRATSDAELLTDYRDGLIPQSEASYRATLSAYGDNRDSFAHVVTGFSALLSLRMEMLETLADHETALARLETLTGATLR